MSDPEGGGESGGEKTIGVIYGEFLFVRSNLLSLILGYDNEGIALVVGAQVSSQPSAKIT